MSFGAGDAWVSVGGTLFFILPGRLHCFYPLSGFYTSRILCCSRLATKHFLCVRGMPKPVWTDRQIKKLSGDECASWLTHCFVESSDRNPHVLHPDRNFLPLPLSYFSTSTTYLLWRHLSPNGVQKDAAYTGVYCGCASMRSKRLICKVPAEGNISFGGWRRHLEIRPQQDTSANLIGIPYQTKWDLKTDGIKFSICPKRALFLLLLHRVQVCLFLLLQLFALIEMTSFFFNTYLIRAGRMSH